MPRKLPLHVVVQRSRHGKVSFYFRVGKGKRIRLPDPTDTKFSACYLACLKGQPLPEREREDPRTIAWLIARYMESGTWKSYKDGTRRQRSNIFKTMTSKVGREPFSKLTRLSIEKTMDSKAETPVQANNFLKAMMGLFEWSVRNGFLVVNPAVGVKRLPVKSSGFVPWTLDDVRLFRERWEIGTPQRLALELAIIIGPRRSDLRQLGRQHLRGNELNFTAEKTNSPVTVEIPPRVLDIIKATPSADLHFISNHHGKPFGSAASFGNWFGDAARKAGVQKNTHGLRKLSATLAADGGATAHELMSQYGWATPKQAEVYTRGADRKKLGRQSSKKVSEQVENMLAPHLEPSEGLRAKNADKST